MKKLLLFILLAVISTQTILCAQQPGSLNSIAVNYKSSPVQVMQFSTENTVTDVAAEKVPGKMQAKKTAKKITSFFTKISKQITKGYEQLAVENSSTAVAISKTSIPGN